MALGSTLADLKNKAKRRFGNQHRLEAQKQVKEGLREQQAQAFTELLKEAEATELLVQNPNHKAYFKLLENSLNLFKYQRDSLTPDTSGYSERIFALVELVKFTEMLLNQPKKIAEKIAFAKKSQESTSRKA